MLKALTRPSVMVCIAAAAACVVAAVNSFYVGNEFAASGLPELTSERHRAAAMWSVIAVAFLVAAFWIFRRVLRQSRRRGLES